MGEITLPRRMFLWCMSLIYMCAFVSLYVQIPGLYGNEGLLPARRKLRYTGKPLGEQLLSTPTLLWLGPQLGLDMHSAMELLCLMGAALSLAALLVEALRDSLVFFCLWALYISMYQVGQVFLYFQWDGLLLETGFLCILVAPLTLIRGSQRSREHDGITFWLIRWLLFRLMFASGVVKLTSRCPTWWGLTALTYHYETQCIPTPLAWFAHQLPVWWQKLSVVGTFVIEIAAPLLFFSPFRRHRLGSFYMQVLLQVLIILTGNYNFFNLLTLTLCLSLVDDQHVHFWLRKMDTNDNKNQSRLISWACYLVELAVWALMVFGSMKCFDLELDLSKKAMTSRTAFTFHQFNMFLKAITIPCIWIGIHSLTWEMVRAMFRCACVDGFLRRFFGTVQWTVFAAAAAAMFTISLVPFTYVEYDSNTRLWPAVHRAYDFVDRYQLVNSYGLFRRMTGVGGRPEVVIEGSYDGIEWTEIEFMYKPGNVSAPPPVVTPHQPRLDWQMWFAALGDHNQAPWFSSLMYRLLQGKRDVIELIQTDVSRYPFLLEPPAYLRAHLYRYWFSQPKTNWFVPQPWWRRVYVREYYPMVHLGSNILEDVVKEYGLKDKSTPHQTSNKVLAQGVRWVRSQVRGVPAPLLIWTLIACSATFSLIRGLLSTTRGTPKRRTEAVMEKEDAEKSAQCQTEDTGGKSEAEEEDADRGDEEKEKSKEDDEEHEEKTINK